MSIFIKTGFWIEKKLGLKGEFDLTRYITDLISSSSTSLTKSVIKNTYASMIADGTPTVDTFYTVLNDENKSYVRSTYFWKTNGQREWIATTPDN